MNQNFGRGLCPAHARAVGRSRDRVGDSYGPCWESLRAAVRISRMSLNSHNGAPIAI
jgi:hypothetical protein